MIIVSPKRVIYILISVGIVLRIFFAGSIGLGVDESYVAAVARSLSLSYFDHPPLHFWLIWLTAHVAGEATWVLRLPFILLFAGSTWLMYRLGSVLFNEWAGVYATLIFNISAVFGLTSASWLLPDGPLIFFMLAATLALAKLFFVDKNLKNYSKWLVVGILVGFGMLSKYHAVFIAFGVLIFLLTTRRYRYLLLSSAPYAAFLAAILIFAPVLIWNYEHTWISFLFQSSRGLARGFYPGRMLANIAGQAVWLLPWIWVPLTGVLLIVLKHGPDSDHTNSNQNRQWFLACLAVGPIAVFTLATLWGSQGLFHWQAPGYLLAMPLLGKYTAKWLAKGSYIARWWLRLSTILFITVAIVLASHTANGWLRTAKPQWFTNGDPSLEALNWTDLPDYVAKQHDLAKIKLIISPHWIDAGKIDYAMGGQLPVLCLSSQPHHFVFMHNQANYIGQDALIIGRKENMAKALLTYKPYFKSIDLIGVTYMQRKERPEIAVAVYVGHEFTGGYLLPYGP